MCTDMIGILEKHLKKRMHSFDFQSLHRKHYLKLEGLV